MPISVDVIIPQYKNVILLERTLCSLYEAILPEELETIWVVENGGKFGAEQCIAKFDSNISLKYIYLEEGNLSAARNAAVKASNADFLIFFDNDMRFPADVLQSYVNAFKRSGLSFFYGGPLEPDYEKQPEDWLYTFLPASARGFSLGESDMIIDTPRFLGGNHALPRSLWELAGGYDSGSVGGHNSGPVGEETRLMEYLLSKGKKGHYVSRAMVKHFVPESNCDEKWILKRAFRHGISYKLNLKETPQRKIFGVPPFIFKELVISATSPKLLSLNKKERFGARRKLHESLGRLIGFLDNS